MEEGQEADTCGHGKEGHAEAYVYIWFKISSSILTIRNAGHLINTSKNI